MHGGAARSGIVARKRLVDAFRIRSDRRPGAERECQRWRHVYPQHAKTRSHVVRAADAPCSTRKRWTQPLTIFNAGVAVPRGDQIRQRTKTAARHEKRVRTLYSPRLASEPRGFAGGGDCWRGRWKLPGPGEFLAGRVESLSFRDQRRVLRTAIETAIARAPGPMARSPLGINVCRDSYSISGCRQARGC